MVRLLYGCDLYMPTPSLLSLTPQHLTGWIARLSVTRLKGDCNKSWAFALETWPKPNDIATYHHCLLILMESGAQMDSVGLLCDKLSLTKRLCISFFLALLKQTMVTHRFTMTIPKAQRNHGNIELINSRTEELLVHTSLCMRVKLTLGLQRFVSDVLGFMNLLASYSPHALIPPWEIPVLCMGVCVHVSVCVPPNVCWHFHCIPPREETEEERKVFPHSLWRSQICHVCSTFSFLFNTSSKMFFPFSAPVAFSSSYLCHIVCTEADQFPRIFHLSAPLCL